MKRSIGGAGVVRIPTEDVVRSVQEDQSVTRFLQAEAGTDRSPCWIRLVYSARNPLVITVWMCAPSQAPVFERTIPRAELRESLQRRVSYPDLVMYPDALRRRAIFRFAEAEISVSIGVSASEVAVFVMEIEALVPVIAELDALNAALALTLRDEKISGQKRFV